jgi:hypothetical protein
MKRTSKLKLNRQTLARIDNRRLGAVQGGTDLGDAEGGTVPAGGQPTQDFRACLSDGFGCVTRGDVNN